MSGVEREDIRLIRHEGHPALEIGDAVVMLRTEFEGQPPLETDKDYYNDWPFFVLNFDEEYFGGLLEITPEFIPADESSVDTATERCKQCGWYGETSKSCCPACGSSWSSDTATDQGADR
jgi:hypothetical protein